MVNLSSKNPLKLCCCYKDCQLILHEIIAAIHSELGVKEHNDAAYNVSNCTLATDIHCLICSRKYFHSSFCFFLLRFDVFDHFETKNGKKQERKNTNVILKLKIKSSDTKFTHKCSGEYRPHVY